MSLGMIVVSVLVVVGGGLIGWAVVKWARQVDWTAYN